MADSPTRQASGRASSAHQHHGQSAHSTFSLAQNVAYGGATIGSVPFSSDPLSSSATPPPYGYSQPAKPVGSQGGTGETSSSNPAFPYRMPGQGLSENSQPGASFDAEMNVYQPYAPHHGAQTTPSQYLPQYNNPAVPVGHQPPWAFDIGQQGSGYWGQSMSGSVGSMGHRSAMPWQSDGSLGLAMMPIEGGSRGGTTSVQQQGQPSQPAYYPQWSGSSVSSGSGSVGIDPRMVSPTSSGNSAFLPLLDSRSRSRPSFSFDGGMTISPHRMDIPIPGPPDSPTTDRTAGHPGPESDPTDEMVDEDEPADHAGASGSTSAGKGRKEKRRMQNRVAQRAFRARTKIHHQEVAVYIGDLEDTTRNQGQQLEQMAAMITALRHENQQLRAAQGLPPRSTPDMPIPASRPGATLAPSAPTQVRTQMPDRSADETSSKPLRGRGGEGHHGSGSEVGSRSPTPVTSAEQPGSGTGSGATSAELSGQTSAPHSGSQSPESPEVGRSSEDVQAAADGVAIWEPGDKGDVKEEEEEEEDDDVVEALRFKMSTTPVFSVENSPENPSM